MLQTLNRQEKQRLHSKFLTTLTIHKKSIVLEVIPQGAPPFFFQPQDNKSNSET